MKIEIANRLHEFEDELKHHDWYYEYSDDFRVWERGNYHDNKIRHLFHQLREEGYAPEAIEIWDKYAPSHRKFSKLKN